MAYNRKDKKKRPNGFIELIEYVKEEIKKRKAEKLVMYAGIGIVLFLGIILVVSLTKKSNGTNKEDPTAVITIQDPTGQESTLAEDSNPLEENAYPEINELINTFYKALEEYDADTYNRIVDGDEDVTAEHLISTGNLIEGYRNITVYTKKGLLDNTYVAFVYFEYKFINIDTVAPALARWNIHKDEQGNVNIYVGPLDKATEDYLNEMMKSKDVITLSEDVNTRCNQAKDSNQVLADLLKHFADKASSAADEEASSSAEATVEATTTETTTAEAATTASN